MQHAKVHRKFGRKSGPRKAMFRGLATSFFKHEKVETTVAKAKDLRPIVEKLITLAGEDTVPRRRQAYGYIQEKPIVHKLFAEIGPKFKERPGGYTRIVRTKLRAGDAAEMAVIELVQEDLKAKPKKKAKKKADTKTAEKKEEVKAEAADSSAEEASTEEASKEEVSETPAVEATEEKTEE